MKSLFVAVGALTLVILTGCQSASSDDRISSVHRIASARPTGDVAPPAQTVDVQLMSLGFAGSNIALDGKQAWTKGDYTVMTELRPNGWRVFSWMVMPSVGEYAGIVCFTLEDWARGSDFSVSAMLDGCTDLLGQLRDGALAPIDGTVRRDRTSVYWLEVQSGRAK